LEAQQEGLLEFVKRLGEKQGWVILAHLLAPAAAPPPPRRESTPMSMSTVVLLYVLMLSVKPSDGLRVGFVDVTAFVPDLLICRPSCQKCGCRPSCRPSSCRFSKPPQLPKLSTFIYTWIFILSLTSLFQWHSGASNHVGGSPASNHVGGSPASHVGGSPTSNHVGGSPASHV
jgi:hypothetical protein